MATEERAGVEERPWACGTCGSMERNKRGYCKACDRRRAAAWKAANKERIADWGRQYRAENRERILAAKRADWEAKKDQINEQRRRARLETPEKFREQQRQSYRRNWASARQRARLYYQANADRIAVKQEEWRQRNIDRVKVAVRSWAERNRAKVRQIKARYEAKYPEVKRATSQRRRERGGEWRISRGLVKKLIQLQRGKCACCGLPLGSKYHMDHIIPLALGGRHEDVNIQLLRAKCNLEKGAKHPVEFMQSRGRLL